MFRISQDGCLYRVVPEPLTFGSWMVMISYDVIDTMTHLHNVIGFFHRSLIHSTQYAR